MIQERFASVTVIYLAIRYEIEMIENAIKIYLYTISYQCEIIYILIVFLLDAYM